MAIVATKVDSGQVRLQINDLRSSIADRSNILKIIGSLMTASVARTFREEGSPAGSWPHLAASTLKKKAYRGMHKLLVLSGRLFSSITYLSEGDTLTIGTNVVYARVQQLGSADRSGGSIGPQARIPGRDVKISAYEALRVHQFRRYGMRRHVGKDGRIRNVHARLQGPSNATRFTVRGHNRHQNIPARPFLVIRPEDPQRIVSGIEAYLNGKALRVASAGGA